MLAIDQWLFVCQNVQLKVRSLRIIITVCFTIPMLVALYDLFLQDVILYDFMFLYIRMSPYTNVVRPALPLAKFLVFPIRAGAFVFYLFIHLQSVGAKFHYTTPV